MACHHGLLGFVGHLNLTQFERASDGQEPWAWMHRKPLCEPGRAMARGVRPQSQDIISKGFPMGPESGPELWAPYFEGGL